MGIMRDCKKCGNEFDTEYCKVCRRDYRKKNITHRRELLRRYKLSKGCNTCGFKAHSAALQFNHIDPSTKLAEVTQLAKSFVSMQRIKEEISKCEVLCSNCHAITSYEQGHHYLGVQRNEQ